MLKMGKSYDLRLKEKTEIQDKRTKRMKKKEKNVCSMMKGREKMFVMK